MSVIYIKHAVLPRVARTVASAAVAAALLNGMAGVTMASSAEQETSAVDSGVGDAAAADSAPPQAEERPKGQLHRGDRLQISFHEYLELSQPSAGTTDDAETTMRTFYQRLDLTGEYRVDVDGTFAVPLLGRFDTDGKTLDELRNEIAIAFERETSRSGEVHVAVLEHQPVFVIGVVRNPGSYSYVPGMIALQAVALAGGFERMPDAVSRHLEAMRERERLAQAVQRLTRVAAQRARLLEEGGGDQPATAHPLLALAGDEGDSLLDGEQGLLEVETEMRQATAEVQAGALETARAELAALRDNMALVERQIEARTERLRVLQQMQGRGVANLEVVWAAEKDATDFELQRGQLLSAIHVAEQKVTQAELERSMVDFDHRARVAKELLANEDEMAQLETAITTAQDVAGTLEALASVQDVGPGGDVAIEILRRTEGGTITLAADETTDLMPGDVVKVVAERTNPVHAARTGR